MVFLCFFNFQICTPFRKLMSNFTSLLTAVCTDGTSKFLAHSNSHRILFALYVLCVFCMAKNTELRFCFMTLRDSRTLFLIEKIFLGSSIFLQVFLPSNFPICILMKLKLKLKIFGESFQTNCNVIVPSLNNNFI